MPLEGFMKQMQMAILELGEDGKSQWAGVGVGLLDVPISCRRKNRFSSGGTI